MAVAHDKPKHTIEDYMGLPEGERVELIGGELLLSPSPRTRHQEISIRIALLLCGWVEPRRLGKVYCAPMDVVLSRHDVVQPDILFISRERASIITEANIQGTPDLIVEILSPGNEKRDTKLKRALYERHGVQEYWIVSPEEETLDVFILRDGNLISRGVLSAHDVAESQTLSGFRIQLEEIFRS